MLKKRGSYLKVKNENKSRRLSRKRLSKKRLSRRRLSRRTRYIRLVKRTGEKHSSRIYNMFKNRPFTSAGMVTLAALGTMGLYKKIRNEN